MCTLILVWFLIFPMVNGQPQQLGPYVDRETCARIQHALGDAGTCVGVKQEQKP